MSVSFVAKNLAGDVVHLSYDASIKKKKRMSYLCSLLYKAFDADWDMDLVWFVEDVPFRFPVEGETVLVLFRTPYLIHLNIVDEESKTDVHLVTIQYKSMDIMKLWTPLQIRGWMDAIHSFRERLAEGNPAPSYATDSEWIHDERAQFESNLYCTLNGCSFKFIYEKENGTKNYIESLLDLMTGTADGEWLLPSSLHIRMTIGSHVLSCPLRAEGDEVPDVEMIIRMLQEDGIVSRS